MDKTFCLGKDNKVNVLPTQTDVELNARYLILDARRGLLHGMERNEATALHLAFLWNGVVALRLAILSPIWIVTGVLIGLLQSYGKCVSLGFALNTLTWTHFYKTILSRTLEMLQANS